jgi:hypothetical protein
MPQSDTGLPVANAAGDPAADPSQDPAAQDTSVAGNDPESIMNSAFDDMDTALDGMFQTLGIEG